MLFLVKVSLEILVLEEEEKEKKKIALPRGRLNKESFSSEVFLSVIGDRLQVFLVPNFARKVLILTSSGPRLG